MLTRTEVLTILREGLKAFKEVIDGKRQYKKIPLTAELGSWGQTREGECLICIAGVRYLDKHGKLISERVSELMKTGMTEHAALKRVLTDAEIILDAMRFPSLSHGKAPTLSGEMTVFTLFRELEIDWTPVKNGREYLTPNEVLQRVQSILDLNSVKEGEGERSLRVVR